MFDKNGIELHTGDIVKIKGSYFKNDNGLYFVRHSPGDPDWCGKDYSLQKIKKNGEISTAKHNLGFYPIAVFVNDPFKRAAAKEHNKQFATIEIIHTISKAHVADLFKFESDKIEPVLMDIYYSYGKSDLWHKQKSIQDHYNAVFQKLKSAM